MPTDVDEKGRPVPAHKWDEQFFKKGQMGHSLATIEDLEKRIEQLRKAITDAVGKNVEREKLPVKAWFREIAWRTKQLETRRKIDGKEADNGDTESEV